ncbi:unnamed protein product [Tuber melanosporum]|uniref:(Perigord truffle) hypothetical protein n=1 Tax=Tuber melanosporum (strain Mel28) TaxID=656061 RepID=D5G954_TUBMM|nr:uncharacterized protein GSTUM_00003148001 [Tuber melanosporum]CAZ81047.1 unnamed protein product [Tuber melanosporum]
MTTSFACVITCILGAQLAVSKSQNKTLEIPTLLP